MSKKSISQSCVGTLLSIGLLLFISACVLSVRPCLLLANDKIYYALYQREIIGRKNFKKIAGILITRKV
jgi:hypothetical protein